MDGATYLNFDEAQKTGLKLIRSKENPVFGLLLVSGINLGLRISDLLTLTYGDLRKELLKLKEKKTGKFRTLKINDNIRLAISYFPKEEFPDNYCAFRSRKGSTYSPQHVNRLIKKYFKGERISTHSLRKTFGRRVWDNFNRSEEALIHLSDLFCHENVRETRKYLGIKQEELNDIYTNL